MLWQAIHIDVNCTLREKKAYLFEELSRLTARCLYSKLGGEYVTELSAVAIPASSNLLLVIVVVGRG